MRLWFGQEVQKVLHALGISVELHPSAVFDFLVLVEGSDFIRDRFPSGLARSKKSGRTYKIISLIGGKAEGIVTDDPATGGGGLRGWISLDLLEPVDYESDEERRDLEGPSPEEQAEEDEWRRDLAQDR